MYPGLCFLVCAWADQNQQREIIKKRIYMTTQKKKMGFGYVNLITMYTPG